MEFEQLVWLPTEIIDHPASLKEFVSWLSRPALPNQQLPKFLTMLVDPDPPFRGSNLPYKIMRHDSRLQFFVTCLPLFNPCEYNNGFQVLWIKLALLLSLWWFNENMLMLRTRRVNIEARIYVDRSLDARSVLIAGRVTQDICRGNTNQTAISSSSTSQDPLQLTRTHTDEIFIILSLNLKTFLGFESILFLPFFKTM